MAEIISILIATILHIVFRFTIFINRQKHELLSLMGFSDFLILLSITMFLQNLHVFPERYKHTSSLMAMIFEIIFCLFFMEVGTVVMWARIEVFIEIALKNIFKADKLNLYQELGGDSMLGFIIISLAFYFLIYSILVTQNALNISNTFLDLISKLQKTNLNCPESDSRIPQKNSKLRWKKRRLLSSWREISE